MKILLATGGSDTARAAADFLVRFPFPQGSEVTLLNVVRDAFFKYEEWKEWEGLDEEHRHELAETQRLVAKEREGLVAKEHRGDLIVMGNKGKDSIESFLLGSVKRRIMRLAPCSVLAVRN